MDYLRVGQQLPSGVKSNSYVYRAKYGVINQTDGGVLPIMNLKIGLGL